MISKPENMRAWVSKPNTPESDKRMYVMHTVRYTLDGKRIETEQFARDPMDAIELAYKEIEYLRTKNEYND